MKSEKRIEELDTVVEMIVENETKIIELINRVIGLLERQICPEDYK